MKNWIMCVFLLIDISRYVTNHWYNHLFVFHGVEEPSYNWGDTNKIESYATKWQGLQNMEMG